MSINSFEEFDKALREQNSENIRIFKKIELCFISLGILAGELALKVEKLEKDVNDIQNEVDELLNEINKK